MFSPWQYLAFVSNEYLQTTGTIFDLKRYALHDGPGIRTTVFMKGCPLDCWWCHNPESRQPEPELVQIATGDGSRCETVGREITVSELANEVRKDELFFDESGGGVTFSGGEPLMQIDFLEASLRACRELGIHTALDTTGYAPREDMESIADLVDLYLYDLKLMDNEAHQKFTGVPNDLVLENLAWLAKEQKNVQIRIPMIPGITDTDTNLDAIARYLADLDYFCEVSLLPYNLFGEDKLHRFGMTNKLGHIRPQTDVELTDKGNRFTQCGFTVHIGG